MIYRHTLKEHNEYLHLLKVNHGVDNVYEVEWDVDVSEVEWIRLHLNTDVEYLKNGLEFYLDSEDYETANMIHKIIKFKESGETELTLPLHRTHGKTHIIIKTK